MNDNEAREYRKKPAVIQARRFDASLGWDAVTDVAAWCGGTAERDCTSEAQKQKTHYWSIRIPTLEGVMTARPGDHIIRGTRGEFYPCKPGPFSDTFEVAAKAEPPSIDREALRGALLNILCNASNFPSAVSSRLLGQDMGPLVEKVADAVIAHLAAQEAATEKSKDLVSEVATVVRRHCTAPSELIRKTDALIAFVADWIENPPDWVNVSYRPGKGAK